MVVTLAEFSSSVASAAAPPADLAPPLAALWWAAKGDWDRAHKLAQDDEGGNAAWVHAYLHRVEGDLPNARYWYGVAGKPLAAGALAAEWTAIVTALLS
jgi:hypothetical protein